MHPKDSIKSTWPLGNKSEWGVSHHIIHALNTYPIGPGEDVPVHKKDRQDALFLSVAEPRMGSLARLCANCNSPSFAIFWTVVREVKAARKLGHQYGFLDGDSHERDGIPDVGVDKVVTSLWKTTGSRILLATCISYKTGQSPLSVMSDWSWWVWLYLQIGLYGIILDFWFYVYHRAMHDIDSLWKYHRTHHLTKHPNTLLAAYADHEQEFFDMVGVPFLTWATFQCLGIPLGFYEWWVCHQYIAFTEVLGHSGLRVCGMPPSTLNWLLQLVGAELVIEDHDLHHRKGYRKSHNYVNY
ncbi:hypothetical protein FPOAC1_007308 [Fusarium poae]|uniref:hypothetical protein n=1 Tax=Fusarium poae TaxID=36050 RepID=UPI001CE8190E|nr:hypothetical protein FPOAC1_007308 [Fusarium poae]KAG8673989.1 hypothetical protein FPOAC1_007308 [Fusarium poae]